MLEIPNRKIPLAIEKNVLGCHLVVSHKPDKDGHIRVKLNGDRISLHRYAYECAYGDIPIGLVVRHKCDNPNCINHEHLEIGTHAENVADRVSRNRSAKGINNGRAKLDEEKVRYIRNKKEMSNAELARIFSVDKKAIRQIKDYKTWKHVV